MSNIFKKKVMLNFLWVFSIVMALNVGGILLGWFTLSDSSSIAGFLVDWTFLSYVVVYYYERFRKADSIEDTLESKEE